MNGFMDFWLAAVVCFVVVSKGIGLTGSVSDELVSRGVDPARITPVRVSNVSGAGLPGGTDAIEVVVRRTPDRDR